MALFAIFFNFFGLPAIDKYLEKEVMLVETRKDTDGIPLPAITLSSYVDSNVSCFKQNLSTECIKENTHNLSESLRGILLGYSKKQSLNLEEKFVSEDFMISTGRYYTLHLPMKIGPDDDKDQIFLLLAPKFVRIFLHDPHYFLFSEHPMGPVTERTIFDMSKRGSHFRRLALTDVVELNTPLDPCNDDQSYNFNFCVQKSITQQVKHMQHILEVF